MDRSRCSRENLSGARVIRAFSRQQEESGRFPGIPPIPHAPANVRRTHLRGVNPATMVIVDLAVVLIIWFGGKSVNAGEVGQGDVVALVNYLTQILIALVALANLIVNFTAARLRSPHSGSAGGAPQRGGQREVGPAACPGAPRLFDHACFAYGGGGKRADGRLPRRHAGRNHRRHRRHGRGQIGAGQPHPALL